MMAPVYGGKSVTVDAAALSGSLENSTTTANIDLPNGPSLLTAYVTYSVSLAMGEALSTYAMGERVETVTLAAAPGQETQAILTTVADVNSRFIRPQCGYKARGIALGKSQGRSIIKAQIGVIRLQRARQGGLAALARAEQTDGGRVLQGRLQTGSQVARKRRHGALRLIAYYFTVQTTICYPSD